jgi:hypothetical protein
VVRSTVLIQCLKCHVLGSTLNASLVRYFDGPYELVGGMVEDRAAAAEWCSLFAPQVDFADPQRLNPVSALAT